MAKNIKIQPEFDAKLKKLRIKTKFMNNFGKWGPFDVAQYKENCLNTNNWGDFIDFAFHWGLSPEGSEFWFNIATENY
jgi:hypothetical protein